MPSGSSPWDIFRDTLEGAIVAAETEMEARYIVANGETGHENGYLEGVNPWIDSNYTSCEVLTAVGRRKGLIMKDFSRIH